MWINCSRDLPSLLNRLLKTLLIHFYQYHVKHQNQPILTGLFPALFQVKSEKTKTPEPELSSSQTEIDVSVDRQYPIRERRPPNRLNLLVNHESSVDH